MLTEISYLAIEFVCLNMREADAREIYGMRHHDNPLQLAYESNAYILNQGRGTISWVNGKPAGVAALTEDWPGVWSVWMFGTDEFKGSVIELVRWIKKESADILTVCKGHRIQCDSMADHHEAHKLIKATGGREDCTFRRYGKNQEDYIRFVWLQDENNAWLKPHYVRPKEAI